MSVVKVFSGVWFLFLLSGVSMSSAAQESIRGQELLSLAVVESSKRSVLVGTEQGVFQKLLDPAREWEPFCPESISGERVNDIFISSARELVFIATNKGLYEAGLEGQGCHKVFERDDAASENCLSVIEAGDGSLFVATQDGLYRREAHDEVWKKVILNTEEQMVLRLYESGRYVYALLPTRVVRMNRSGKYLKEIYLAESLAGESGADNEEADDDEVSGSIRSVTGSGINQELVYLGTSKGIFVSQDCGNSWESLSLAGFDPVTISSIDYDDQGKRLIATNDSGVYAYYEREGWSRLVLAHQARETAFSGNLLIVVADRDVFEFDLSMDENDSGNFVTGSGQFLNEPTIREVQEMAEAYAEVSNQKIKDWRRKAALKAFLPDFSIGYDKNVYGSYTGSFAVGPRKWDVSLSWDLGDLIYNDAQTSIDVRSKLMVQLRNDILAEVTRLYFERRKIQLEMERTVHDNGSIQNEKKLKAMELTALIDRLTGGKFSGNIE